jgi:hypothetical protein
MKWIALMIGFLIANYGYQAVTHHDYAAALDRLWFQAMALLSVWIFDRHFPSPQESET